MSTLINNKKFTTLPEACLPRYPLNRQLLRDASKIAVGALVKDRFDGKVGIVTHVRTCPDTALLGVCGRVSITDDVEAYGVFIVNWGSHTQRNTEIVIGRYLKLVSKSEKA